MNLQQQSGPQAGPGLGQTPAPQPQTDPVGAMPPPAPQGDPLAGLTGQHDQLLATFKKLQAAGKTLGSVRKVLDGLMKSGDTVKPEDVVSGAADLVGSGLTPKALVGLMADMPSGGGDNQGPALQAWVAQHDVDVTQREAQLLQVKQQVGHQLGVAGLRALMGHALMQHTTPGLTPAGPDPMIKEDQAQVGVPRINAAGAADTAPQGGGNGVGAAPQADMAPPGMLPPGGAGGSTPFSDNGSDVTEGQLGSRYGGSTTKPIPPTRGSRQ